MIDRVIVPLRWPGRVLLMLGLCFSVLFATPHFCIAKTLAKVSLSDEGTSTGLPDLFTGTMSYSIPIETPAGRKGMDPGLALSYRSGNGYGLIGVGWELELGSIQRPLPSTGTVDYAQNNFLLTRSGSSSTLVSVGGNTYQTKIEGGFSRITTDDAKSHWVVTDKTGLRFFYGQTAASRQDGNGSILKWCLDRIEDTNGNYIAIYYYKDQGQIYLNRIEYTGNAGLDPTNYVNFYWESRLDSSTVHTAGFPVTTAYRLATIDVGAKPTPTTPVRIRTYKMTYDCSSSTSLNSLLHSVQQFDKNTQVSAKTAGILSSGQVTGGTSLPEMTMLYDLSVDSSTKYYLTSFSNGMGGTTNISYSANSVTGTNDTTDTVQNVASVTVNDGNGNISKTYYHYTGGYYYINANSTVKEFRGFNVVEVRGPVSDDGKQVRTMTYFHQGDDIDLVNNLNASVGYMRGKPYSSITYAVSGVITGDEEVTDQVKISKTTTSYVQTPNPSSAPYFTPINQIDSYLYDGDTVYKHSKVVYKEYDKYGNVGDEYRYGDVDISSDDITIRSTYSSNVSKWIVGLPTSQTVFDGIETKTRSYSTNFFYDGGITDCSTASYNQNPDKGLLTRVERLFHYEGETSDSSVEGRAAYDGYGNPTCRRDPKGYITTIRYDPSGTFPLAITNPLGQQVVTQYYGVNGVDTADGLRGQVKSVVDPNGAASFKYYDTFGRPSNILLADGTSTGWEYKTDGIMGSQRVRTSTSDGLWTEKYFDGLGRTYWTKTKGPESKTIETKTAFDARGAVRKSSLPYISPESPRYVLTDYDAIGRVIKSGLESPEDKYRSQICYNKDETVKIDPNNHRRREVRDASGRLVKVQEYTGTFDTCTAGEETAYGIAPATTKYQYDALGNLRFVTDAKGNQTEMRYDTLGRKRYMHDPDMGVWTYSYDANGNLETQIDAKKQTINFEYDDLNRLKYKKYGSEILLFNYYDDTTSSSNSIGRISATGNSVSQTQFNYDNMGRTTSTSKTIVGTTYNHGFSFLNGRLDSITYPDSEIVKYTYDSGYLKSVAGYIDYSNFDPLGRPWNATYGTGGASSLYTYYAGTQRLYTLSVVSPKQGLLIDNVYDYDNKGNITSINDRLDKPILNNFYTDSYTLDTSRAHAVGSTSSGRSFQYDDNGNIKNDGLRGFTYNYDNMPTEVNSTSFFYDGNSSRVRKSSSGKTTDYVNKLYECTNGVCTKFIFANGTRIAAKTGNQVSFFHPDHQGSTSVITDAAGDEVDDITYHPFGSTRLESNTTLDSHKYTDQEQDSETGLYNYNARLYDPDLGRFMSPDSIVPDPTNPQSLNRYAYVLNNPLNYTDPSGHYGIFETICTVVAVAVISYLVEEYNGDEHSTTVGVSIGSDGVSFNASNGNSRSSSGSPSSNSGSSGSATFWYFGGDTAFGLFNLYDYNAASYDASPYDFVGGGSIGGGASRTTGNGHEKGGVSYDSKGYMVGEVGLKQPSSLLDPVNYLGGIGSGALKWLNRPYWRYVSPDSNPASPWMTRGNGWKPPYGRDFDKASDALQMPFKPMDVKRIDVPWYEPVRGPRPALKYPDLGKGGGPEYAKGWTWPD